MFSCVICSSASASPLIDFGMLPVPGYLVNSRAEASSQPIFKGSLVRCEKCGHVQQEGSDFYEALVEKVYNNYRPTYSMSKHVSEYMNKFLDRALALSKLDEKNSIVLEIGSNDGSMFEKITEKGFRAAGIDPSADTGLERDNIIVMRQFFSAEIARSFVGLYGAVKLIYSRHTLEHVFDPVNFMAGLSIVLDDDGLAVIEVPYLPTQTRDCHYSGMTFQHISYFTVSSLKYLAGIAGLEIADIAFSKMDGGSVIVALRKYGATSVCRLLDHIIDFEKVTGSISYEGLSAQFLQLSRSIKLSREYLEHLALDGVKTFGYGAGAKGQSLLNQLGIGSDVIKYVIDDTPGSDGMFIPGVGSEVIKSGSINLADVDVVLITAPTHINEIIDKERDRLSGKPFIATTPNFSYCNTF